MARAVISGFITFDYVARIENVDPGVQSNLITQRIPGAWPRIGGAPIYSSEALAAQGHEVIPLSYIGPDEQGDRALEIIRERNWKTNGIRRLGNGATPVCIFLYQDDGEYLCYFDPGCRDALPLDERQRQHVRDADLVALAICHKDFNSAVLDEVKDDAVLAWIAKADPESFPPELRRTICERANYILCNQSERAFVDQSLPVDRPADQVIIETRGAQSITIEQGASRQHFHVDRVEVLDPTGAGDTFAGATLGHLIKNNHDIQAAIEYGVAVTRSFLTRRSAQESC